MLKKKTDIPKHTSPKTGVIRNISFPSLTTSVTAHSTCVQQLVSDKSFI